jgi:hypothetical protein
MCIRDRAEAWSLSKSAASLLGSVTGILAIVTIALSVPLNPTTEGPYIGVLWGSALLLLSASILSYFYASYINSSAGDLARLSASMACAESLSSGGAAPDGLRSCPLGPAAGPPRVIVKCRDA